MSTNQDEEYQRFKEMYQRFLSESGEMPPDKKADALENFRNQYYRTVSPDERAVPKMTPAQARDVRNHKKAWVAVLLSLFSILGFHFGYLYLGKGNRVVAFLMIFWGLYLIGFSAVRTMAVSPQEAEQYLYTMRCLVFLLWFGSIFDVIIQTGKINRGEK